jgi:hypothetical protein
VQEANAPVHEVIGTVQQAQPAVYGFKWIAAPHHAIHLMNEGGPPVHEATVVPTSGAAEDLHSASSRLKI